MSVTRVFAPTDDEQRSASAEREASASAMLGRIADALGVPPEALSAVDAPQTQRAQALAECVELLRLFEQVTDRQARNRCLSYLRAAAEKNRSD